MCVVFCFSSLAARILFGRTFAHFIIWFELFCFVLCVCVFYVRMFVICSAAAAAVVIYCCLFAIRLLSLLPPPLLTFLSLFFGCTEFVYIYLSDFDFHKHAAPSIFVLTTKQTHTRERARARPHRTSRLSHTK